MYVHLGHIKTRLEARHGYIKQPKIHRYHMLCLSAVYLRKRFLNKVSIIYYIISPLTPTVEGSQPTDRCEI